MEQAVNHKVTLAEITINEQVRKEFDKTKLNELAESIKTNGMIQPIGLNKKGKKLFLIFGERRCRAIELIDSKTKGTPFEIDAKVYTNLTDEEVLELQIIENLQRVDVTPMEEANGFLRMMTEGKLDEKQIASKVGKNIYYVRQRLKLNSLIPQLQKALKKGRLTIGLALNICAFSVEQQKEIFDDTENDDKIEIDDYQLKNMRCDLTEAPFDIKDKALSPKIGACTTCIFNTAYNTLFPEDIKQQCCLNQKCFEEKSELSFVLRLKEVVSNPEVILVDNNYGSKSDEVKAIEAEHGKVYDRNSYRGISKPDKKPNKKEYDIDNYDDKDELEADYKQDLEAYEEELAEYNEAVKSSKIKKAFIVNGNGQGNFIDVILEQRTNNNSQPTQSKATFDDAKEKGTLTIDAIDAEINRIKSASERKDEIENQKITAQVHDLLDSTDAFIKNADTLSINEFIAMIVVLYGKIQYRYRMAEDDCIEVLLKNLGFIEDDKKPESQFVTWLQELSKPTLNILMNQFTRLFIASELKETMGNYKKDSKSLALWNIAKEYVDSGINDIYFACTKNREKRDSNVTQSINKLKDQRKEIAPPKKKS